MVESIHLKVKFYSFTPSLVVVLIDFWWRGHHLYVPHSAFDLIRLIIWHSYPLADIEPQLEFFLLKHFLCLCILSDFLTHSCDFFHRLLSVFALNKYQDSAFPMVSSFWAHVHGLSSVIVEIRVSSVNVSPNKIAAFVLIGM